MRRRVVEGAGGETGRESEKEEGEERQIHTRNRFKPQSQEAMDRNSHPRLDSCLLYFTALWLCMELRAAAQDESQAVCCAVMPLGAHPKSCATCGSGKCCADNRCHQCRPLPKCQEGEELCRSGTIDFRYFCRQCPSGTFSDTKSGCCIPWEDCMKQGLQTLQAGNRTHNVRCGPAPTSAVTQCDFAVTSIFTVLAAAGVFVLLLMTFLLIVCTCMQKKATFPLVEEPESPQLPNALESHLLQEDTYSCQFPQEEHGGKMVEP